MDIKVNPNGTVNRAFRPALDYENTTRRWTLFDPSRVHNWGLYGAGAREPAESFPKYFNNLMRQHPRRGMPNVKSCSALQNW